MSQDVGKHSSPRTGARHRRGAIVFVSVVAIGAAVAIAASRGLMRLPWLTTDAPVQTVPEPGASRAQPNDGSDAQDPESQVPADPKGDDASQDGEARQDKAPERPQSLSDQLAPTVRATSATIGTLGTSGDFASSEGYARLTQAIGSFEDKGYNLSFSLKDLTTGATLTYQPDVVRYPASSIKGPYLVAIYEMLVDKGQVSASSVSGLAESLVVNSDNDAFRTLHKRYGERILGTWLSSFGFDVSGYGGAYSYTSYYYPHTSAAQLEQMWEHMYSYLSSGSANANYLASLFLRRDVSPIATAVGSKYQSWGKAGWYPTSDGLGSAPATVDAGVVLAGGRPYVLAVMSNAPSDLDSLAVVCAGLDAAHDGM